MKYLNRVHWVWIDTYTLPPLDQKNIRILNQFMKCLVYLERLGRTGDIGSYKESLKNN